MKSRTIIGCLIVMALFLSLPGYARELSRYEETVTLSLDGSAAVRLALVVGDPDSAGLEVLVPLFKGSPRDLQVRGVAGASVRLSENKGNLLLALSLPGGLSGPVTVEITYMVDGYFEVGKASDFGNRDLAYRFVNVTFDRIANFSAVLVLPSGQVLNTIGDYSPKPKKQGGAVPYSISRVEGKDAGIIKADDLRLGDEVSLGCTFKSATKSRPLFFALILLAAAYLVVFRDILRNGGDGKNGAGPKT